MNESFSEHEVLNCFQTQLLPLSKNLTEMLNEHFSHQTERRGCGFTQATRVIADFINLAADETDFKDFKVFSDYDTKRLRTILSTAKSYGLDLKTWRDLDQNHEVQLFLSKALKNDVFYNALNAEVKFQSQLRSIAQYVKHEESKLICDFLEDIILRKYDSPLIELKSLVEKPKVGSCPMAENFFLKIAHRKFLRHGLINIFVNDKNEPILIEKVKMGDDHSCINLVPVIMNGIRIPEGSLFSVQYNEANIQKIANKTYKGFVIPLSEVEGFWFLRLTTLAVSPQNRQRAFTSHFKQQIDNGLFSPGTTQLAQLKTVALEQI
ncbi:hypothetical protein [Acinetobacter silvestris]|uniref:Uncharacterized protein n=1 Tax=Acinetobacter silvestris TaxID=1977882 RepID=A0A1Y3CJZ9_9GAMM|nr:hypothetical protein [Acinetobacter silvestris]OTG66774.1 hypothetical protein B9T28_05975 [Acinetobacter silvestris]